MAGTLVSTTIPNLINGVSQQPYALRLASQAEVQINGYSSVVEGLRKRAGSRFVAKLSSAPAGELFSHVIDRDERERYQVILGNGFVRVYDLMTGQEKTVNAPQGLGYLSAPKPTENFRAVTVADHTYIVNNQIKVEPHPNLVAGRGNKEALLWFKQGSYGTKYELWIDNSYFNYTTPDGSTASHINEIQTSALAARFRDMLINAGLGTYFDIGHQGSLLHIIRKSGLDFTMNCADSQGNTAVAYFKQTVQRFSDLPAVGVDGFQLEIVGDQSSSFDNYYVRFDNQGGRAKGVWVEHIKTGESMGLNDGTMPHVLRREANGNFTFARVEWATRKVGDMDSNPQPSFVSRYIRDIFFHRNRLGLIADENVIFSRAGEFYNFYVTTATAVIDSDPIDVAVSHVKVSILQHAVPFNETLLLFSEQTQFTVSAGDLLTPDSISINQTTEFDCSRHVRPVGVGRNMYFVFGRGNYCGIREYYVDGDTQTNDAVDVTSHVPSYLPANIRSMAASSAENVMAMVSANEPNVVLTYKFLWADGSKQQSSWSRWEFDEGANILAVNFIESNLYMVIRRADGVYLERLDLSQGSTDAGFDFEACLDRKVYNTNTTMAYNAATEETEITLPIAQVDNDNWVFVIGGGDAYRKAGEIIPHRTQGSTIYVKGRVSKFVFGRTFRFRYRFSTFVLKEEARGGGEVAVGEGRLQIRKMAVTYAGTGFFRAIVTPLRRDPYIYPFTGRVIGSASNVIGKIAVETGRFSFPIMAKSDGVTIEVESDKFLPVALLSAEWEALYTIRSRRI